MGHADALSRLPLPEVVEDPAPAFRVLQLEGLPEAPLQARDIARRSARDPVVSRVLGWVVRGWPEKTDPEFAAYATRRDELSAHKGCLLWGDRVVVPHALRQRVLQALHEAHPGIVRMKGLARSYVWWPGIDAEVEAWVKRCQPCQAVRPSPPGAPAQAWESTRTPWSRLHIDFAGPFPGRLFLVTVDSYSKWLEISPVAATSAKATIRALRGLFATHGLPDTIVSDNGTAFTSEEFQQFLSSNLIRHVRSAPFHPATNGQAERMVRTAKEALSRMVEGEWECRIARFLLTQHTTPNPVSGRCPAELLMGRKPTILLDRLHPDRAPDQRNAVEQREAPRGFFPEDPVLARNFGRGPEWIAGRILRPLGTVMYEVSMECGQIWRRHIDQLRQRVLPESQTEEETRQQTEPRETTPEATAQDLPAEEHPAQGPTAPASVEENPVPEAAEAGAPAPSSEPGPEVGIPEARGATPRRSARSVIGECAPSSSKAAAKFAEYQSESTCVIVEEEPTSNRDKLLHQILKDKEPNCEQEDALSRQNQVFFKKTFIARKEVKLSREVGPSKVKRLSCIETFKLVKTKFFQDEKWVKIRQSSVVPSQIFPNVKQTHEVYKGKRHRDKNLSKMTTAPSQNGKKKICNQT
ncbi:PREDICTED: uncharacterized protein K02A2.6-like [Gekko japonicus]|uniref:Gypsy retrotransposon integrase-like protein 1 n=1 Tax=Gekko japonicus TaxID=146911 RepID=A0ABM1K7S5_GEKJA|nr:PREDICTED: uncharacterized protein K02A2.6-like [Gekko japonicus]